RWMECARASVGPRSTDPFADETSILPSSQMPIAATPAQEQALTRFPPAHSQIVIELLPCELSQLEADRPTRFPLPDRHPVDRVPVGRNVVQRENGWSYSSRSRRA